MPQRRAYQSCCYTAALDPDVAFCPDCGSPLFRCFAFNECKNLVNPQGFCEVCVQPQLALAPGAIIEASVGEVLSIPFILSNMSPAGRSLTVLQLLKEEQRNQPGELVRLDWETLEAGRSRAFSVVTEPLTQSGVHRLRLILVLASCLAEIEEHYAFSAEVAVPVEGEKASQVVQNIDLSGSDFGTAGMVVANPDMQQHSQRRQTQSLTEAQPIPLQRAERTELENEYRGYKSSGARLLRNVRFEYLGFPPGDIPEHPRLPHIQPVLHCGRNSRRYDAARNPEPNDLCLRVYDSRNGALDPESSKMISRHLCDFILQNDRLYLRAHADGGMRHNEETLASREVHVVRDGDTFSLPAGHPQAFRIGVKFLISSGIIKQISFARSPQVSSPPGAGQG